MTHREFHSLESRAADASVRLSLIGERRREALGFMLFALQRLADSANEQREHGAAIDDASIDACLTFIDEGIGEMLFPIINDLEQLERGEGRYAEESQEGR